MTTGDTLTDEYELYRWTLEEMERDVLVPECPTTRAYIDAMTDGIEESMALRVMLIGCTGAGKSSLTRNLLGQPQMESLSTDGIDVHRCTSSNSCLWNKQDSTVYDIEADRFACIIQQHDKSKDQTKSYIKRKDIKSCFEETRILQKAPRKLLLLQDRTNNNEQRFVKIWDFGGQFVYYATHQLFHSRHAVYLLVLDASMQLDDVVEDNQYPDQTTKRTVKHYCKFWMHSIQSYVGTEMGDSPPVILVATHTDAVKGGWSTEKENNFFEGVRTLFDGSVLANHIQAKSFALNNKDPNSTEYERLRNYIMVVAENQMQTQKLCQPARWIPLETAITENIEQRHISLDELNNLDLKSEMPIKEHDQMLAFLKLHHSIGDLVYFDNDGLSDTVILDPKWIIDAFRCIITSNIFCLTQASIRPKWKELIKEAKLSKDLVDAVWSEETNLDFIENKSKLLLYMSKLGILSTVCEVDIETAEVRECDFYIVPSLLHSSMPDNILGRLLESSTGTTTAFVFAFDNQYVSPTLYHRITAAALGHWKVLVTCGTRLLFDNIGIYELDEVHSGVIELRDTTIELRVLNRCRGFVSSIFSDRLRRFVALVILNEYHRSGERHRKMFTEHIRCNIGNVAGINTTLVNGLIKCPYTSVPCPDNAIGHTLDLKAVSTEWQLLKSAKVKIAYERPPKRDIMEVAITDHNIVKFADAIGKNWQVLGLNLGLNTVEIERIELDRPHHTIVQVIDMLKQWSLKENEKATIAELISKMKDTSCLGVNWDGINNILDALN